MYNLFVKIFSIFPEKIFAFFEGLFTKLKYGNQIKRIKKELSESDDASITEFARKLSVNDFCFKKTPEYIKKYKNVEIDIGKDENGNPYYIRNNKEMYLKNDWNKTRCKSYIRGLLIEQDEDCPHHYFTKEIEEISNYGTVIDLGAAEGIFSIDVLDRAEKIYAFEPDDGFFECLNKTFKDYSEKVVIEKEFIGEGHDGNSMALDDYFGDNIPNNIGLIKMDIEGAEQSAIKGMKKVLDNNSQAILLVCCYHSQNAEKEIRELLSDYDISVRDGFMLVLSMNSDKYPYVRHGVLEAKRMVH